MVQWELLGFTYCIWLLFSYHRNENPDIHEELPDVFLYQPQRNLIQQYGTTSYLGAYERSTETNGIYVNHLKKHLAKDIHILDILKMVRKGEWIYCYKLSLNSKYHVIKTQSSWDIAFLTQAQGRELEVSGQLYSLTALLTGKNIPHWLLDVGPRACLEVMEKRKIFLSYIPCGFKWCRHNVTFNAFHHYNIPLQQVHFSAYTFIFFANIGW
jgi:hypothetical protein